MNERGFERKRYVPDLRW